MFTAGVLDEDMHVYRIVQPTTSKLCSRGVEALKTGSSQDAEDHKTQGSQQTECDAHRFRQLYVRFSPGVRDFVQHWEMPAAPVRSLYVKRSFDHLLHLLLRAVLIANQPSVLAKSPGEKYL